MTTPQRSSLLQQGYYVARNTLSPQTLQPVRDLCTRALSELDPEVRGKTRSQGSLINLCDYPAFSDLIAHPGILGTLATLGLSDTVFSSGYVISKPPASPPLFWHQDWWGWDHPISYTERVAQIFVMVYLTETSPRNGCLRVIPGSHRRSHSLHHATSAHADALSRVVDADNVLYQPCSAEVAVEVSPGDIVIGDARLLHGAYGNATSRERTCVTLWYHPGYSTLPAAIQARIREIYLRRDVDTDPGRASCQTIEDWPPQHRAPLHPLLPAYNGKAPPQPWNRQPDCSRFNS